MRRALFVFRAGAASVRLPAKLESVQMACAVGKHNMSCAVSALVQGRWHERARIQIGSLASSPGRLVVHACCCSGCNRPGGLASGGARRGCSRCRIRASGDAAGLAALRGMARILALRCGDAGGGLLALSRRPSVEPRPASAIHSLCVVSNRAGRPVVRYCRLVPATQVFRPETPTRRHVGVLSCCRRTCCRQPIFERNES